MAEDRTTQRCRSVEALLRARGLSATRVSSEGADGEIAVVETAAVEIHLLADLVPEIRALGFRYVTVELEPGPRRP